MACTYLHILPIIVFVWFPASFLLTFTLAVIFGHVHPFFPYISDTATFSPESCLFGELISIGVLLFALVIYVRYRQIRELYQNHNLPYQIQKLNQTALIIGLIGVFGVSIVGNFQETNVISIHLVGAFTGFGLGTVYLVLQTLLSYKLFPMSGKTWILYTRVVICCICVLFFMMCVIFAVLSIQLFTGKDIASITKWTKSDGGWEYHIVSTISEWITAISIMSFILTLSPEFRNISLSEPVLHLDESLIINDQPVS